MKIAFITTISGLGGSELLWNKLAEYALEKEHSVYISVAGLPEVKKSMQKFEQAGAVIEYRGNSKSNSVINKAINYFTAKLFKTNNFKKLQSFNPDIIIISGDAVGFLKYPDLLDILQKIKKPYIHISHGGGGFFKPEIMQVLRTYYNNASMACFVAKRSLGFVELSLAQKINNGKIIRNPVSFDNHQIIEFPKNDKLVSLACVSRINLYTKGHHHLLEALAAPDILKFNWQLDIYGDGEHYEILKEYINFFGLQNRVFLKGNTNDVRSIWENHHLYLLPSLTESAPIALVEAMICGRPSVVTNVGGVKEWIEEDVTGYISHNAEPVLFRAALLKAFQNINKWEQIGIEAHNKAIKMMGNPVEDFYQLVEQLKTNYK